MGHTEYHWAFQPPNYFEAIPTITGAGYSARFDGEHIYVRIDEPMSDALRDRIERQVEAHFRGNQLVSFKPFVLTFVGHQNIGPNGEVENSLHVATGAIKLRFEMLGDTKTFGPGGVLMSDSKAERLKLKADLGEQFARHATDLTLQRIAESYASAIREPQNELIHLYEIKDALGVRFGGLTKAKRELGISKKVLDDLTRLANNEPILEGRHRGEHASLRPATKEDSTARATARKLISRYLDLVDGASSSPRRAKPLKSSNSPSGNHSHSRA